MNEDKPTKMEFDVKASFNPRLITPYRFRDRTYYLLFFKDKVPGPFYVQNAAVQPVSLVFLGDIRRADNDRLAGHCFYSQAPVICTGSYLLAYSGVFRQSVQTRLPSNFEMDLVLRTPRLQVFHKKNKATLIVSPTLRSEIRQNLEV